MENGLDYLTRPDIDAIKSHLNGSMFWKFVGCLLLTIICWNLWSINTSLQKIANRLDGTVYTRDADGGRHDRPSRIH